MSSIKKNVNILRSPTILIWLGLHFAQRNEPRIVVVQPRGMVIKEILKSTMKQLLYALVLCKIGGANYKTLKLYFLIIFYFSILESSSFC